MRLVRMGRILKFEVTTPALYAGIVTVGESPEKCAVT
jgi:hypothetical protein